MKKLLIVRSASMQQLDNNLKAIINTFPDYEYHMLTHEHSVKLVEKYDVIKKSLYILINNPFQSKDRCLNLKTKFMML